MRCRLYPAAGTCVASWWWFVPAKSMDAVASLGKEPSSDMRLRESAIAIAGKTCPPVPPAAKRMRSAGAASLTSAIPARLGNAGFAAARA